MAHPSSTGRQLKTAFRCLVPAQALSYFQRSATAIKRRAKNWQDQGESYTFLCQVKSHSMLVLVHVSDQSHLHIRNASVPMKRKPSFLPPFFLRPRLQILLDFLDFQIHRTSRIIAVPCRQFYSWTTSWLHMTKYGFAKRWMAVFWAIPSTS
jgi:hypothetical protein